MQVDKIVSYIFLTASIAIFGSVMTVSVPAPKPEPKAIAIPAGPVASAPPAKSALPEGLSDPTLEQIPPASGSSGPAAIPAGPGTSAPQIPPAPLVRSPIPEGLSDPTLEQMR